MRSFDPIAVQFEAPRAWPPHISLQFQQALLSGSEVPGDARILEIGCGTGRVGKEFCRELAGAPVVCAEGAQLPFASRGFDLTLLIQVIGPRADWPQVLAEAIRVLRPGGVLAMGRRERAADSLEARLNRKLNELIPAAREDAQR